MWKICEQFQTNVNCVIFPIHIDNPHVYSSSHFNRKNEHDKQNGAWVSLFTSHKWLSFNYRLTICIRHWTWSALNAKVHSTPYNNIQFTMSTHSMPISSREWKYRSITKRIPRRIVTKEFLERNSRNNFSKEFQLEIIKNHKPL